MVALCSCAAVGFVFAGGQVHADDTTDTQKQLQQLQQQNETLQEQLRKQQALIETLSKKMDQMESTNAAPVHDMGQFDKAMQDVAPDTKPHSVLGNVSIGGEGAVGFFSTQSDGQYPNSPFRVDEARLFVESVVYDQVYFYGEIDMATPETTGISLNLGECYLDFENVSRLFGRDDLLNIRVGRMYIPFGEEYLRRYAIDNPFISRSLSDIWGVDAGVEVYGTAGRFFYVAAVQNGGVNGNQDYDGDKSVTAKLAYDPNSWLHLSVSAMRTGNLDSQGDQLSALWFGGGWIRSLSPFATKFHANLVEGDVQVKLRRGYLRAFGGYVAYDDNDAFGNNSRGVYYYTVQGVQDIWQKLYGGVSFSQILAPNGFPLVGYGNMGEYMFGPLTGNLWRLSLCLGYRFSPNLILKGEYSFEQGQLEDGTPRNHENLFALEAAFRF